MPSSESSSVADSSNDYSRIKQEYLTSPLERAFFSLTYAMLSGNTFNENLNDFFLIVEAVQFISIPISGQLGFGGEIGMTFQLIVNYISKPFDIFTSSPIAFFWIAFVFVIFAILNSFYVLYSLNRSNKGLVLALQILRIVVGIEVTVLFMPLCEKFINFLACYKADDGVYRLLPYPNLQCFDGGGMFRFIVSIIMLVIFSLLVFPITLVYVDEDSENAQAHGRLELVTAAIKFFITFIEMYKPLINGLLFAFMEGIMSTVMAIFAFYYLPYRRLFLNQFKCFIACTFSWATYYYFFSYFVGNETALIIFFTGIPIPLLISIYGPIIRRKVLFNYEKYEKENTSNQNPLTKWQLICKYIKPVLPFPKVNCDENNKSINNYVRNIKVATDPYISASIITEMQYETKQNRFDKNILAVFDENKEKFPNSSLFWLCYLSLLYQSNGDVITSLRKLGHNTSFDLRFLIYRVLIDKKKTSSSGSLGTVSFLDQSKTLKKSIKAHRDTLMNTKFCWETLCLIKELKNAEIMKRVNVIFGKISAVNKVAIDSYRHLMKKYNNNPTVLRSYACYLEDIHCKYEDAIDLYKWANELEEERIAIQKENIRQNSSSDEKKDKTETPKEEANTNQTNDMPEPLLPLTIMSLPKKKGPSPAVTPQHKYNAHGLNTSRTTVDNNKSPMRQHKYISKIKDNVELEGLGIQKLERFSLIYVVSVILFVVIIPIATLLLIYTYETHSRTIVKNEIGQIVYGWKAILAARDWKFKPENSANNRKFITNEVIQFRSYLHTIMKCYSKTIFDDCYCSRDVGNFLLHQTSNSTSLKVGTKVYYTEMSRFQYIHSMLDSLEIISNQYNNVQNTKIYADANYNYIVNNVYGIADSFVDQLKTTTQKLNFTILFYFIIAYSIYNIVFTLISSIFLYKNIGIAHREQHLGFDCLKMLPVDEYLRITNKFMQIIKKFDDMFELNQSNTAPEEELQKKLKLQIYERESRTLATTDKVALETLDALSKKSYECGTRKRFTRQSYYYLIAQLVVTLGAVIYTLITSLSERQLLKEIELSGLRYNNALELCYISGDMIINKSNATFIKEMRSRSEKLVNDFIKYHQCLSQGCDEYSVRTVKSASKKLRDLYYNNVYNGESLDSLIVQYERAVTSFIRQPVEDLTKDNLYYGIISKNIDERILTDLLWRSVEISEDDRIKLYYTSLIIIICIGVVITAINFVGYKLILVSFSSVLLRDVIIIRMMLGHVDPELKRKMLIIHLWIDKTRWVDSRVNNDIDIHE